MTLQFTQNELLTIAQQVLDKAQSKVLLLQGPMGAGKTTLVKALVTALGGADAGNSPTFGLVNEYHYPDGRLLGYHFDFYRLNDETEALDMGLEDYLAQEGWVFMEWPEKIASFLPTDAHTIQLTVVDDHTRELRMG